MARLNRDGTLDDSWDDPFQGGDPYMGGGTDPTLDGSINSLSHIFPNETGGGTTPPPSSTFDYSGTTGMPPPGGFTWPGGTPAPVIHPGDQAANVPGLPMGTKPSDAANPGNSFDNYLSRHPGDPQAAITEWMTAGDQGGLAPKWYPDSKTIGLANGTYLVAPGSGGNNTAGWQTVQRGSEGAGGTGTGGAGSQVNDVLSSLLTKLFGSGAADPNAALRKQLSDKFGSLMDQYSQPVSPDDPVIRANTDAYHGIEQRSLGQYGEMAAERAHAEGVPVGAFDSAVGNATASAGRDEAANLGSRMTNETNARRSALGNVLGTASNFSNVTDARKLSEELAVLSDATGNQQFYDSLASGMGGQQNSLDSLIATLLAK